MSQNPKEWAAPVDDLKRQIDEARPLSPEQENAIFTKFRLDWTFHSNAIEGNRISEGETRVLLLEGLTAQGKPIKDYLDLAGHNDVIDYLLDFIHRKDVLTEAVIRELQKILLVKPYEMDAVTPDGKPAKKVVILGAYKSTPNQVMHGKVARVFTSPLETPAQMEGLMAWLRKEESPSLHPVEKAALFHHQFVSIHPFDDGNGRLARILMNLLLMQDGYPPVVIRIEDRDRYFAALVEADAGDPKRFVEFIAEKLVYSMELYLRGARGESIEDVDDINRKIALLKKELEEYPDALEYSPDVYQRVFENCIIPLIDDVIARGSLLDPLFSKAAVAVYLPGRGQDMTERTARYVSDYLKTHSRSMGAPRMVAFEFRWENFKKTPFKPFNVQVRIEIHFHPFVFELTWATSKVEKRNFLYTTAITQNEVKQISAEIVKMLYDRIQESRTKAAEQR